MEPARVINCLRPAFLEELQSLQDGFLTAIKLDYSILAQVEIEKTLPEIYRVLHPYGILQCNILKKAQAQILKGQLRKAGFQLIYHDPTAFRIEAIKRRDVHTHDQPLTYASFIKKCRDFKKRHPNPEPTSFIVTVCNEEKNLPHFFSFLDNIQDATGMEREFIFVLNGCTDNSEQIIREYANGSKLKVIITHSEQGILPAFKKGIASRTLHGKVGRFDADILLHPYTLDLMQMFLVENPHVKVTYAEPKTLETPSAYNEPWYNPAVTSKRLYYTGKTSLYQESPFADQNILKRAPEVVADDVWTSFYFVYYFGFDAIARTPHALVYEKVAGTFPDLVRQLSRINSEIQRIFRLYPEFEILITAMTQDLYPSRYKRLTARAQRQTTYVDSWLRLESTK